jgi:hypothetical protein
LVLYFSLTPLIPLSDQLDITGFTDKPVEEGEKLREGAKPPLPHTPLSSPKNMGFFNDAGWRGVRGEV